MNTSDPQAVGEENNCKAQQIPIVPFAVDILGEEKFLAEVEADALFIYFCQEPAMCVCWDPSQGHWYGKAVKIWCTAHTVQCIKPWHSSIAGWHHHCHHDDLDILTTWRWPHAFRRCHQRLTLGSVACCLPFAGTMKRLRTMQRQRPLALIQVLKNWMRPTDATGETVKVKWTLQQQQNIFRAQNSEKSPPGELFNWNDSSLHCNNWGAASHCRWCCQISLWRKLDGSFRWPHFCG